MVAVPGKVASVEAVAYAWVHEVASVDAEEVCVYLFYDDDEPMAAEVEEVGISFFVRLIVRQ